jgi:hypothetical protein
MMSTKPFSELKISAETIKFEREQLDIYKSLVVSNPHDRYLKRAMGFITRQISNHEKMLKRENKLTQACLAKKSAIKKATKKNVAEIYTVMKAVKKKTAKKPTASTSSSCKRSKKSPEND